MALNDPETRENALLDLSKKRDMFSDLAPILWHSYGVIPALLQEIVSIYPLLSPPSLTAHASNRVCNALALLQCVASHPDTRALFLNGARTHAAGVRGRLRRSALPLAARTQFALSAKWPPADGPPTRSGATAAHIPLFLYPFLNTVSKTRPFEYLRLTSLGVIGALVKVRPASRLAGPRASLACAAGVPHACARLARRPPARAPCAHSTPTHTNTRLMTRT